MDFTRFKNVHDPTQCEGRLCDFHGRPGVEPWASWPRNWRSDRSMLEMVCDHGTGHPTPSQIQYWLTISESVANVNSVHGCCGCCAGSLTMNGVWKERD